ncbi:orcinol O-methyltransferase-like protein, partial [Striga asiatica]
MALPDGITSSKGLLEAQAQIWNHTLCFINSMSLKCAVELGIPDIIHKHDGPITISQLTDSLKINGSRSTSLRRLVRLLVNSRLLTKVKITDTEDGYCLTPASRLLVKNEPLSLAPFVHVMLSHVLTDPWHCLSQWFSNDDPTPLETTNGVTLWDIAAKEPGVNRSFNKGMASDAGLVANVVVRECGHVFRGLGSLVDVGGGTGAMAEAIADAFPGLKCSVLDLPHVVDGLEGTPNLSFVSGDMFESIPPADAVLMKWVMHDWGDEDCIKILKRCKEAIPSRENGGKVIIVEIVVEEKKGNDESMAVETQLLFDMEMMAVVGGKERTEKEWAKLFYDAGFTSYEINMRLLGLRSLIQWVMHDWGDVDCIKILKRCKEAIPSRENGGKVIIVEIVVEEKKGNDESMAVETQLLFDMEMMAMLGGKERTAQAHIWNHTLCFITSMSLKCVVELGLPDIIHKHDGPITISQLTDSLNINGSRSTCLRRLVRLLVNSRLLTKVKITDTEDGYCLTPASRLLVKNEPLSLAPFVHMTLSQFLTDPWHRLSQWFANDDPTPLETAYGGIFWDIAAKEPGVNRSFNEGMASDARLAANVIVREFGHVFQGLGSVVDVAGGTGAMAEALVDAFPGLKCSVLELPHVVDGLEGSHNLSFVGGDMFESIPPADAVLMK